ncbi:MAG: hypothetical protein GWN93_02875 [Deltaproteobacteria bacterium]|nr:hypothetical protein [Deltaproteobacteria bacterium]
MRKLWNNNHADLNMILGAVVTMVMLAISIVIVWNVVGSIDTTDLDTAVDGVYNDPGAASTEVTNATSDLTDNLETFYSVAPIVLIVMAAVGILGYVLLLRRS